MPQPHPTADPMPADRNLADRTARLMIGRRFLLACCGLLTLLIAWPLANKLQFDRRIEQMFPADAPAVDAYDLLRARFGGNAVAMMVYTDTALLSPEGLERAAKLARQAESIPGVLGVLSLAQVNEALAKAQPPSLFGGPTGPPILESSKMARGFLSLFAGYTHDRHGELSAIVAILDPERPEVHNQAIAELRRLASELPEQHQPVALVGEPVLVAEGFSMVDADGKRLATTTIVLLGAVTLILFRSPRWVLAQLVIILWSVQATRGLSQLLGLQLSMVSSMLTAIVTVIAVACVIHLAVGFGARRRRGDSPHEAAHLTLSRLLPPIFWACVTDAAGFAALTISAVGPVRDFGMMMTLGTGTVLLGVALWSPLLMLLPSGRFHTHLAPGDRRLRRMLVRTLHTLHRHRTPVFTVTAAIAILTLLGLRQLQTETNFIRNFRASSELAQAYEMVESQFGGAGVWDVILPAPQTLSSEYLASVRTLERALRDIQIDTTGDQAPIQLTKVLSMADGDAAAALSRLLRIAPPSVRLAGMRAAMPTFVDALLTPAPTTADPPQPRYLRIMLRSPERTSSAAKLQLIDAVQDAVEQHTGTPAWQDFFATEQPHTEQPHTERAPQSTPHTGRVTGYYVLLALLIESLLADQWLCLLLASVAVLVMIAIAFRSITLALVCMVPNLLPVLAVLGALGLSGTPINMGAAMIAAVSIGLTIDGSIHFVSATQKARRRGDAPYRAVLHAQRQVGLPVLLATVALALGFSVLATSPFIPTVTFGILVTAALATGTIANLTILPLLLTTTLKR